MANLAYHQTPGAKVARCAIYAALGLMALFYLAPLFVMLSTSLKSLDEVRTGNLLSMPGGDQL
ncbi:hypothetical protein ACUHMQ_11485 [Chitinimonas sp. PSY-7]|uniref:hypothetical protein n=1 Tax=Chitinimonas sp. PSY-7 TaxID=3459088 RepID=UPI00403FCA64